MVESKQNMCNQTYVEGPTEKAQEVHVPMHSGTGYSVCGTNVGEKFHSKFIRGN